jgi:hypothetical protein
MKQKTMSEIRRHCLCNGYSEYEMGKICGFLIAKGLKSNEEKISYKQGNHKFEDFIKWFEGNATLKAFEVCEGDVLALSDDFKVLVITTPNECGNSFYGMDENNRIVKFSIDEKTSICGKEETNDFIEKLEKDGFSVKDFLLGDFDMDDDDDEEEEDDEEECCCPNALLLKIDLLEQMCKEGHVKLLADVLRHLVHYVDGCTLNEASKAVLSSIFEDLGAALNVHDVEDDEM